MGNYFTSMQIYGKEKMSQEQFIDKFCREICDEGYVVCGSDESELSYIMKFADNCQWVTITSEDYKDDMDLPRKDVVRISKMLGTVCVQTTVIDSDCAIMELYDAKGEQADMFVMGRADDYFGDNIPQPKESIWKPFLTESTSWDDFNNLKNGDYVFVEDGLSELAPAIGMNSRNLVLEADEAVEDEQTVFLYFIKADAKKEKKLTLNAAFKQVFGEALEPLGFVKIKSRHPYYVRVVNGEILNIITFNKDYKTEFSVFGGIATLYRKKFDFDQNVLNNLKALNDTAQFYYYGGFAGSPQSFFKRSYSFSPDDSSSVKQAFLEAVSHTKQYIIPVMDNIASLRDCVGHFMIYQSPIMNIIPEEDDQFGDNESLLYFKIDDHSDMTHEFTQYLACHKSFNDYNTLFKHSEEYRKELIQKRDAIYNNNEQYQRIISEISSRKKANIEKLQQYGLFQESKTETETPKKLTLNAAFKQVFGEALEPLGFKLLKNTKTPIFVRFINDEIMHVITYRKLGAMKTGYNRYEVSCGAISLYRRNIDLDDSPENWLINMGRYYYVYNISVSRELKLELIQFRYDIWGRTLDKGLDESTLEEEFTRSLFESQCNANDSTEMLNGIRLTCKVFKEIALPVLNSIIDLDSYIEFCYEMTPKRLELAEINEFISDERYSGSDGLILILANYRNDGKERTARMLEKGIMALGRRKTPEKIEMLKASYENERAFQVAVRDRILDTPELKSKAMNEAKKIQSSNIDRLKH